MFLEVAIEYIVCFATLTCLGQAEQTKAQCSEQAVEWAKCGALRTVLFIEYIYKYDYCDRDRGQGFHFCPSLSWSYVHVFPPLYFFKLNIAGKTCRQACTWNALIIAMWDTGIYKAFRCFDSL